MPDADPISETPPPPETLSEESLRLLRWQEEHPDYWGDQDENGVDLARLRENLALTPAERLRRLDDARRSLRWLQNHARERNAVR